MSTNDSENERELKLLESSFSFHEFTDCVANLDYTCNITKLKDSFYVWIGKTGDEMMNDLSYAFPSAYDNLPVSTSILCNSNPSSRCDYSSGIAMKLTSLTKNPVYVSCNVDLNHKSSLAIQERLINEFKNTPGIMDEVHPPS